MAMTAERTITVQPGEQEVLKKPASEWGLEIKANMPDGSHLDGKGIIAARRSPGGTACTPG